MKPKNGRQRVVITNVVPEIEGGRFAIKRILGDVITVSADAFSDGHASVAVQLLIQENNQDWQEIPMNFLRNDRWEASFIAKSIGITSYTIHAWVDHFRTWQQDLLKKYQAGLDVTIDLLVGVELIEKAINQRKNSKISEYLLKIKQSKNKEQTIILAADRNLQELMRSCCRDKLFTTQYSKILEAIIDIPKANFSTWYELFPRSCFSTPHQHGTLRDCEKRLPEISQMGFDILYLPPIHPIGLSKRRGKNNQAEVRQNEPGSPWAVGFEGGHKDIHPQLGTIEDFEHLLKSAKDLGIDIAMDLAFQCSPDHPYLKEHIDWFKYRPDGSLQYAENPPKKYEDIIPLNFETENWQELWEELKSIVVYWIEKGIRIFRVDNPHTKPFTFWEWLITDLKKLYPELIFLCEAFTRPKVMNWLSKLGFSQSYTYFIWRRSKKEIIEYMSFLTDTEVREYFRPNFWPNTPDILPENLQYGNQSSFAIRFILAATLSSNYGIYGPAFELMINKAIPSTEEYLDSEKYEIKYWEKPRNLTLRNFISQVNQIRKQNLALQTTNNIKFYEIKNDQMLFYIKSSIEGVNTLLIIVSLDPYNHQSGVLKVPLRELGITPDQSYKVHELLSNRDYIWEGETQHIDIDPIQFPACIFQIHKKLHKEVDFDYFM